MSGKEAILFYNRNAEDIYRKDIMLYSDGGVVLICVMEIYMCYNDISGTQIKGIRYFQ